jgi:ABC-type nitrate/sulfonate/bicarbonate transport system permease component
MQNDQYDFLELVHPARLEH